MLLLFLAFATLLTADVVVCSANLAAAHNMTTAVSGVLRHRPRYLFVTGVLLSFLFGWHLPIPARPIPSRELVLCRAALVPCTERFTSFGIAFLDPHGTVTKADDLFLAVLTCLYNKLLRPIRSAPWFVAFHF